MSDETEKTQEVVEKSDLEKMESTHAVANMGCRRKMSHGSTGCGSMTAYIMAVTKGANAMSQFRCTECGFSWSVATGGSISF